MNKDILVRIITPGLIVLECEAEIATMPGEHGEFGVLPEHSLLIASLHPGIMKVSSHKHNFQYFVYGGMVEVRAFEVNVATEFAIDLDKIKKIEIIEKISRLRQDLVLETETERIDDIARELEISESLLSHLK